MIAAGGDRAGEKRRRLFFALWPDSRVRQALKDQLVTGGRAVADENRHVTLMFLGAIEQARQQAIEAAVDGIRAEPFRLLLDRRGHWRRSGVTWVAASETPPAMGFLQGQLSEIAAAHGVPVETRPFVAHLTLARRARIEAERQIDPIEWAVDAFCLVESVTLSAGVQYHVLRRWPLGLAVEPENGVDT